MNQKEIYQNMTDMITETYFAICFENKLDKLCIHEFGNFHKLKDFLLKYKYDFSKENFFLNQAMYIYFLFLERTPLIKNYIKNVIQFSDYFFLFTLL